MKAMIAALALVISVGAAANQAAAEKAVALADSIESLDTTLHDLGYDKKAEAVHELEAVALDIVEMFDLGEVSKSTVNSEMRALYNELMQTIRIVRSGCNIPAVINQRLNDVIRAYNNLFYTVYPPQPGPCESRRPGLLRRIFGRR